MGSGGGGGGGGVGGGPHIPLCAAPPPSCPRAGARHGPLAGCPKFGGFWRKPPCPPLPHHLGLSLLHPPAPSLHPTNMCSRAWRVEGGGARRKKFHAIKEAARATPSPQPRTPPAATPTEPPTCCTPPGPPRTRNPAASPHHPPPGAAQQTTARPSSPPRAPSESRGRKTPKAPETPKKHPKIGGGKKGGGKQERSTAPPSTPCSPNPPFGCQDYFYGGGGVC